jgi:DNA (cytosine-5)-methyltransferase 1
VRAVFSGGGPLATHKTKAQTISKQRLKAISLFTGVGGLDFGFEAAGFHTSVALELDPVACQTIRLNRTWPVIEAPIKEVDTQSILRAAGLSVGEADVLIGGPPCQPFSKSGYWRTGDAKRLDDPRAGTLTEYLRVLGETKPRVFLLENVPGLAFDSKNEGLQYLLEGIERVNKKAGTKYQVSWQVLNAASYGVPQIRERVFLVGARDGTEFRFPTAKYLPVEERSSALPAFRTAWDAIGDLPGNSNEPGLTVGGKWGDLLPSIPEGNNYLWHTPRGSGKPLFGWRTRYWSFLLKLAKNRPSWTIQAQPGTAIGPFHWQNRRLTSKEMCRLQTFPEGLRFECRRSEVQRLLGNAVPSLLAETLAWEIRRQLLRISDSSETPNLLPPLRGDCPPPEPTTAVPRSYNVLIGDHAAHPGTGKGRSASTRAVARLQTKSKAA